MPAASYLKSKCFFYKIVACHRTNPYTVYLVKMTQSFLQKSIVSNYKLILKHQHFWYNHCPLVLVCCPISKFSRKFSFCRAHRRWIPNNMSLQGSGSGAQCGIGCWSFASGKESTPQTLHVPHTQGWSSYLKAHAQWYYSVCVYIYMCVQDTCLGDWWDWHYIKPELTMLNVKVFL